MKKYRLMVPGPTPLPPEVTAAAIRPMEDERTQEYAAQFTRVIDNLRAVLCTRNDVLLFASSMTGAFEGAVHNLFSRGDRVLIANNGAFSQRWVDLCRGCELEVVEVRQTWGEPLDPRLVEAALAATPGVAGAIAVHCETSTGVVNDIAGFAAAARGVVTLVDSAAGLGACELRTDDWGVDVVVSGGQKALMTPPGLAFASISNRAWAQHQQAGLARYYFDWDHTRDALRSSIPRTPWTPAISLINQLDVALQLLHAEGLEQVLARHVALGRITRAGARGMGLDLFSPDEDRHASVTAVRMPDGVDSDELVDRLVARHGIQLTGGTGPLAGKIVRFGHCGWIDAFDVLTALAGMELALIDFGHPVVPGGGVAAALRVFAEQASPVPATPEAAAA